MVVTYYFVDLPVGLGFDKIIRPLIREINFSTLVFLELTWFVILGGLYWFCIGLIITKIRERVRPAGTNIHKHN
jgi:antibiotic biosynthesis monooxygenase (ABM) superfamily enzyme